MSAKAEWSGLRCPRCGAEMLAEGIYVWCSFIECDFGCWEDEFLVDHADIEGGETP